MLKVITGRNLLNGEFVKVSVDNGRISSLAPCPAGESTWLAPGLIDLQVNGYLGCDLNSGLSDPDIVIALTRKLISAGVTTYLPTIITSSEEAIIKALCAIAKARNADSAVAHAIPFVHLEGPYISPNDGPRGAHNREHVRPARLTEFARWQAASGDLVGLITISPHRPDAVDFIAALARKGVIMAIGHTDATPAQIHDAGAAGARLSTHLGNGVGSPLPRHPNLLWAQLADDRLTASFIADGHHLPNDTLKSMLRAKGSGRSILVSDVVSLGGMPPGKYRSGIGGPVEVTRDGRVVSTSGPQFLAGSYHPLVDDVAHVAAIDGFSLSDAIQLATVAPGRFASGRGVLRPGEPADIIRFQWDQNSERLKILTVMAQGKEFEPAKSE